MKQITLIICTFLFSISLYTQNDQYTKAMQDAINGLEVAESAEDFKAVSATFERIAQVAKTEWLPNYYRAYTNIHLSWISLQAEEYSAYDLYIEAAEKAIEKANEIVGEHAEVYVLEAYLYQAKIQRKPMVNGMRYSSSVTDALARAKELDPDNPRAYFINGNQLFHMPAFVGGGKDKALPEFETAAKKFANFKAESDLHPNWGAQANEQMLAHSKS